MTLDDSIQGFRLRVLQEAQRSGNVSATCRCYDVSRTVFYRAAGWPLKWVLTDNGKEFMARFVTTCADHQVRPHAHQTPPCVDERVCRMPAGDDFP
jgi:hypothetical protein